MERPIFQPVGTPGEELDTPALVVDIEVLQQNIDTVHGVFRHLRPDGVTPEVDSMVRPHVFLPWLPADSPVAGIRRPCLL